MVFVAAVLKISTDSSVNVNKNVNQSKGGESATFKTLEIEGIKTDPRTAGLRECIKVEVLKNAKYTYKLSPHNFDRFQGNHLSPAYEQSLDFTLDAILAAVEEHYANVESNSRIDEVTNIPEHEDSNGVVDQLMPIYKASRLAALQAKEGGK